MGIYDIDLTILEADATSTMVVMRPNANTPTLKNNEWLKVFLGFGNAEEAVNNGVFLTYKVGIVPGQPAEDQLTCLPEILAASPEESALRKRRREPRQKRKKFTEKIIENQKNREGGGNKSTNRLLILSLY